MLSHSPLAHLSTFARLHRAGPDDLPRLKAMGERLAGKVALPDWTGVLADERSYVLVATECGQMVGAGVLRHDYSAAEAQLLWLFVNADARGRGIGQLLVETLIGRARSEGGAVLEVAVPAEAAGLAAFCLRSGFLQLGGDRWVFGLWNGFQAQSYCDFAVPTHQPVADVEAGLQSLLVAMGTLDATMLLTPRALQVLAHEVRMDDQQLPKTARMALAAARRRHEVRVGSVLSKVIHDRTTPEIGEWISAEAMPTTPEMLVGQLARQHLCLLRLDFARIEGPSRWYLVTGFDGFLFRLHDVTAPQPVIVTSGEMRVALQGAAPQDALILAKVL
jgi:GNAT superfamily N-acetyltransferase